MGVRRLEHAKHLEIALDSAIVVFALREQLCLAYKVVSTL